MTHSRKRVRMPPSRPRYRNSAEEQTERDQRKDVVKQRLAAITICELAMRVLGCKGAGCGRGHQSHVKAVREVLMVLGVIPDPEASGISYGYRGPVTRKKAAG